MRCLSVNITFAHLATLDLCDVCLLTLFKKKRKVNVCVDIYIYAYIYIYTYMYRECEK